ncbi:MAG: YdcF family protein [Labilithrix sp.]|nr:YdcF family protein [Labilithrix sp.]MCW5815312.1 YdcF family protein [Labilithrix sp.]
MIFVALATPWRRPRRPARWKRQRLFAALGLATLYLFSTDLVGNWLFRRLEQQAVSTYRPDEVYDAVVLLGGVGDERVEAETGELAWNDSVERLITTHRVLAEGRARFAILSGGSLDPALVDHTEARMLARQLARWGIAPSRLIVEEQARNTRENAVYSKRIVEERAFTKVLVVTSAFHMRRSEECFAAVGLPVDTLATDFRAHGWPPDSWLPRASSFQMSTAALRETFGLYIYRARGYARAANR